MSQENSYALARAYRDAIVHAGIPVLRVLLFGSIVRSQATEESDIDIAVVCTPFGPTRMDETLTLWQARRAVDLRIEPLCLHADDFKNPLSLACEIERTGVEI